MMIALAALTATGARGSQVTTAATHRKSAAATSAHSAHSSAYRKADAHTGAATSRYATTSRMANSHTTLGRLHSSSATAAHSKNASHHQSAEEVGWRAGLAIRGRRAQPGASHTRATLREVRLSRTYAARENSAADFDTSATTHSNRAPENSTPDHRSKMLQDAAASVAANSETGNAAPAPPYTGQSFAAAAPSVPASTEAAEPGAAPAERMAPSQVVSASETAPSAPLGSPTANIASANQDAVDRNAPPPTEAASVRTEAETEEASLTIPHGLMPSPLRGSLESLTRQNSKLDAEGLERIEDESDLAARIADGLLVPVPESLGLVVNGDLLPNHRYCRPWTAKFLADLARQHNAAFHKPLEVSSAVRTVEYQRHLMRTNGNAAPAEGDVVSPHLTGATVDIAKSGLTRQEMGWMRQHLLALQSAGKIDVEEEFRQACFHITVYRNYAPDLKTPTRHHAPSAPDQAEGAAGM